MPWGCRALRPSRTHAAVSDPSGGRRLGSAYLHPPVNEQSQATGLANLILKLRTYRKEEGDGSKESKTMAKKAKNKENREQRRRGRKEQDHLPVTGSGKEPVTIPPKPLTESNAMHSPTPMIRKTGFIGIRNQEQQQEPC